MPFAHIWCWSLCCTWDIWLYACLCVTWRFATRSCSLSLHLRHFGGSSLIFLARMGHGRDASRPCHIWGDLTYLVFRWIDQSRWVQHGLHYSCWRLPMPPLELIALLKHLLRCFNIFIFKQTQRLTACSYIFNYSLLILTLLFPFWSILRLFIDKYNIVSVLMIQLFLKTI